MLLEQFWRCWPGCTKATRAGAARKKALAKDKLPKPLDKIAKEIGQSCRPKCGKKMPANKKLKEICEYTFRVK